MCEKFWNINSLIDYLCLFEIINYSYFKIVMWNYYYYYVFAILLFTETVNMLQLF